MIDFTEREFREVWEREKGRMGTFLYYAPKVAERGRDLKINTIDYYRKKFKLHSHPLRLRKEKEKEGDN